MATLDYKNGLSKYRRYLQVAQKRPMFRASLFVILTLVLLIILVVTALKPTLVTIAGLVGDLSEQAGLEKRLDQKIAIVTQAQQTISGVGTRLSLLDEALPEDADIGRWSESVGRMIEKNGLSVVSITINGISLGEKEETKKPEPTDQMTNGVSGINFSLSLGGQYASLRQFVEDLQSLRRLMWIEKAEIGKQGLAGEEQLLLNIVGKIGYAKKEN